MQTPQAEKTNYIISGLLGAAAGGLVMLVLTQAIPRMMQRMMSGMMETMRAQMHAEGCQPEEM